MAALILAVPVVGFVAAATAQGFKAIGGRKRTECYAIAAAAFSAIFGVQIICEEEAKIEIEKGNPDVKRLEIKDLFKLKPRNFDGQSPPLYYIPDSAYDPQYDYDFTNHSSFLERCTRGGYPYKRPAGWKRKAVRVIGKYKDDVWLGQQGWRSESSSGEWPVSFHGTRIENVQNIVTEGYDIEKFVRHKYGRGIYSTPYFEVAERYAIKFNYKGEAYKCMLQNRVNLEETETVETLDGPYFITPNADNIRPYGLCIKKL